MNEKVSVILPIYNVKQYLNDSVNSVVHQSYKALEIILVDDGSVDGSGKICDDWGKKDNRIKVIHKDNGGLSSARNAGMDAATGEYFMFTDSDDQLEQDIIEKSLDRIRRDQSDVVIFGYRKIDEQGNDLGAFTFGNETLTKNELLNQLFQRICEMSFGYAWNKLYRSEMVRNSGVRADSNIIDREDLIFNLELMQHMKKISYLESIGYFYLQRNTSLLHNSNLARLQGINQFCKRLDAIVLDDISVKKKVFNMCVLHYLSDCIIKNIFWNDHLNRKEKLMYMDKIINGCPLKEQLYRDPDNAGYLNVLYDSIYKGKANTYYRYVSLSDFKRKLFRR